MAFSIPKPLNGWRPFLGEVGIIVLGVLIALGTGQVLEAWQWQQQVKQTELVFRQELGVAAASAYGRMSVDRCLHERLESIARGLNEEGGKWEGMVASGADTDSKSNPLPAAYRAPHEWYPMEGWSNALSDGTLNHLSQKRRAAFSSAYTWLRKFKEDVQREHELSTKLDPLATNRLLSEDARIAMLQSVAELKRLNEAIYEDAMNLLSAANTAQISLTSKQARKSIDATVKLERQIYGDCVETPEVWKWGMGTPAYAS